MAQSPSSRRAWIEISTQSAMRPGRATVALLAEGVDRNQNELWLNARQRASPSSRRAWIEICQILAYARNGSASPSSRRAWIEIRQRQKSINSTIVALLAEGVDRNTSALPSPQKGEVALLAEGVDRNHVGNALDAKSRRSPSSRRAWIEIYNKGSFRTMETVALLAEGVDRNNIDSVYDRTCSVALLAEGVDRNRGDAREECGKLASPSSRRAWIEIFSSLYSVWSASVALLAEGVDRNTAHLIPCPERISRPSCGGRG